MVFSSTVTPSRSGSAPMAGLAAVGAAALDCGPETVLSVSDVQELRLHTAVAAAHVVARSRSDKECEEERNERSMSVIVHYSVRRDE